MISIDICLEENTISELSSQLHCIASAIEYGYTSGYGWTLTGEESLEEEDDEEDNDEYEEGDGFVPGALIIGNLFQNPELLEVE